MNLCTCGDCRICDISGIAKARPDARTVADIIAATDPHAKPAGRHRKPTTNAPPDLFDDATSDGGRRRTTMTAVTAEPEVIDGPEKYVKAAYKVAKRYARYGFGSADDLAQVGLTAIVQHWAEWDSAKSNRLTWAMRRCRWAIGQEAARGVTDRMVRGLVRPVVLSIDARDENGRVRAERDRGTWVYDSPFEEPTAVAPLLAALDARSRDVIDHRFGLNGKPRETLSQIGVRLKLSRERVRQIERIALERMHLEALRRGGKS